MLKLSLRPLLTFIFTITVLAQICLADNVSVTGPNSNSLGLGQGNGQQALLIDFSSATAQNNLTMNAILSGAFSQTVSWWVTDQVGPSATAADVLYSGTFAGPSSNGHNTNVFSGVNLAAGNYFVVLSTIGQGNDSGWDFTGSPTVISNGLSYGGSQFASLGSGNFAPSYNFGSNSSVNFEFDIENAATPTPEPSSLALLGTGFLSAGAFARRKLNR